MFVSVIVGENFRTTEVSFVYKDWLTERLRVVYDNGVLLMVCSQ